MRGKDVGGKDIEGCEEGCGERVRGKDVGGKDIEGVGKGVG